MKTAEDFKNDFQTPPEVAKYMVSLLGDIIFSDRILEPTPGDGNIVRALEEAGYAVATPSNYFDLHKIFSYTGITKYTAIVANPPFSEKSMWGMPEGWNKKGMRVGYQILKDCMNWSDEIVILLPAFTLSDSDVRAREIKRFGLVSVAQLPRKTFAYARIQTVILHLKKGYTGPTEYRLFDLLNKETYQEEL